ncbi:hypothetical protein [uncultured Paludibaculum sp.]|uniref:hypothetical protein n=1 Tax=uncultured Paludibaculum sp. TaxID=1765020 RepID=UPI002AABC925|nr:hypothetical protein [uncultured Paludibaculum sp.]
MSLPFRLNLVLGLRFLQVSLLVPLHRNAPVGSRALPIRFQEVSRVKRIGREASDAEKKQYREAVKTKNLSRNFVEMGKQLRALASVPAGPWRRAWKRLCRTPQVATKRATPVLFGSGHASA